MEQGVPGASEYRCARGVRGFTLIELMIAVAVVGILAAIAYPAYLEQIRKSRRSTAQAVLMQITQKEMQILLDARQYVAAADSAALAAAPLNVSIDSKLAGLYTFAVTATNSANAASTFIATATPQGTQVKDSCAVLSVNQAGVKTPASGCW